MKKKGFLLATTVGAAFAPAAGQAADMAPVLKAPPPPIPVATWTGFYIGAHVGAAWEQASSTSAYAVLFPGLDRTLRSTSVIAGGQAGYNWQHGNWLFGLEADGSWLSKGSGSSTPLIIPAPFSYEARGRISWLSTVRTRFGLVVGDTMAYVTGGVAFGGVKNCIFSCVQFEGSKAESKTRVGWAIGGGVEHMLTRNWIIGLEGLFVDLGGRTVSGGSGPFKTTRFSNEAVIGRLKLNYKF